MLTYGIAHAINKNVKTGVGEVSFTLTPLCQIKSLGLKCIQVDFQGQGAPSPLSDQVRSTDLEGAAFNLLHKGSPSSRRAPRIPLPSENNLQSGNGNLPIYGGSTLQCSQFCYPHPE